MHPILTAFFDKKEIAHREFVSIGTPITHWHLSPETFKHNKIGFAFKSL